MTAVSGMSFSMYSGERAMYSGELKHRKCSKIEGKKNTRRLNNQAALAPPRAQRESEATPGIQPPCCNEPVYRHAASARMALGHSAHAFILCPGRPVRSVPRLAETARERSKEMIYFDLLRPIFTDFYRCLPIFTDFSDFLGRLQPSKTTTRKTPGTLGVEESSSPRRVLHF